MSIMITLSIEDVARTIQGESDLLRQLQIQMATEPAPEIVLLKDSLLDGLEAAADPTVEGLHRLASLLQLARVDEADWQASNREREKHGQENPNIQITADVILSTTLGRITAEKLLGLSCGARVNARDVDVMAGLLCLQAEDRLHIGELRRLLTSLEIVEVLEPGDRRSKSFLRLDQGFIDEVRSKALGGSDNPDC